MHPFLLILEAGMSKHMAPCLLGMIFKGLVLGHNMEEGKKVRGGGVRETERGRPRYQTQPFTQTPTPRKLVLSQHKDIHLLKMALLPISQHHGIGGKVFDTNLKGEHTEANQAGRTDTC